MHGVAVAAGLVLLAPALALAAGAVTAPPSGPVQWPAADGGNDHWYELVVPERPMTWAEAEVTASQRRHAGRYGHLVTITSAAENAFLVKTFAARLPDFVWMGASDAEKEGTWRWVVGPEAGRQFSNVRTPTPGAYANWGAVEPNNMGDEDVAALNLGGMSLGTDRGQWGDTKLSVTMRGYIVEYGPGPSQVARRAELRFVRQSGARFERITGELGYAEPFFLEAQFSVAPEESEQPVTLEWGTGGTTTVLVRRTGEDRRLYRSGSLVLSPEP